VQKDQRLAAADDFIVNQVVAYSRDTHSSGYCSISNYQAVGWFVG
jgi:hypothetical protein